MTKDFNRDLDQAQDKQSQGRGQEQAPDADPKVARERKGEGFEGPADAYAESGSRGAGYREDTPQKKSSDK
jgi:hypothetical protein